MAQTPTSSCPETNVDGTLRDVMGRYKVSQNRREEAASRLDMQRAKTQSEIDSACRKALPINSTKHTNKDDGDMKNITKDRRPRVDSAVRPDSWEEQRNTLSSSDPSAKAKLQLETELKQERDRSTQLEVAIQSKDEEIKDLKQRCTNAANERMKLIDAGDFVGNEMLQKKYESLKQLWKEQEVEKRQLRQQLEEAEDKIRELEGRLREMKNDVDMKEDEIAFWKNRLSARDEAIKLSDATRNSSSAGSCFSTVLHSQSPSCPCLSQTGIHGVFTTTLRPIDQHDAPVPTLIDSSGQQVPSSSGETSPSQDKNTKSRRTSMSSKKRSALRMASGQKPIWKP